MSTKRNRSPSDNSLRETLEKVATEMAKPRVTASVRTPVDDGKPYSAHAVQPRPLRPQVPTTPRRIQRSRAK
jgi:hypothetical protein